MPDLAGVLTLRALGLPTEFQREKAPNRVFCTIPVRCLRPYNEGMVEQKRSLSLVRGMFAVCRLDKEAPVPG